MSKIVLGRKHEVKISAVISDDNEDIKMFSLMGFRIHYPQLWYLGILNILKEKNLRKKQKQKLLHSSPTLLS